MSEFWVDFGSVLIEASDFDEAEKKARQLAMDGEVEIDQIVEK